MIRRLRLKFVLINMTLVTTMLLVIFGTIYGLTKSTLVAESQQRMRNIALDPYQTSRITKSTDDGVNLPYFILSIDRFGGVLAIGGGYFDLSDREFLWEVAAEAMATEEIYGELPTYHLRYYRLSNSLYEYLVFLDTTSEKNTLHTLLRNCVLIGGVSFLLFLLLSVFLSGWAVRPVEKAFSEQRRFVADASHELKTPLAVILTNAELLGSPDYSEGEKEQFTSNILVMARRMRSLVESLLTLARSDSGQGSAKREQVDFSHLLEMALLPYEPMFFEHNQTLSSEVEKGLVLEGDEEQLKRLTDIFLDNAYKYGKPGGEVSVLLKRQDRQHLRLTVGNEADPVSEEECRRIFDRFTRLDPSRTGNGGYGLGLSIAETIVKEHGGKVFAEYREGKLYFVVVLPTT